MTYKGKLVFLFDTHEFFSEIYELPANDPKSAMASLRRIAQARQALLARNVRIVQLAGIKGHPMERVEMRGTRGDYSPPLMTMRFHHDNGRSMRKTLRGFPKEYLGTSGIDAAGLLAVAALSRVLIELGCVVKRNGQSVRIGKLQPWLPLPLKVGPNKPANKTELVKLLGREKGETAWAERKAKESRQ